MPKLTRWFLKAALSYFVLAMAAGVLVAGRQPLGLPGWVNAINPVYFHMFMLGWVTQLIFGIAYWMFPKYSREQPHRSEGLAWAVFWMLNAGLGLRVIAEPWQALQPTAAAAGALVGSAALQWAAAAGFVANTWGRVKGR
ncbi:MAG: cbb3-type cytochrome c oxidase subunit I [Anaerolineae bacterium]|nr:cbb3-type cytochrome c oxidase subunit I [Anaerolineae bacterium]